MPTEVIKTVGPGKDYASLAAWVAGQAGDMRAGSGSDTIQIAELYAFTDTTPVVISGFTGDADHYVIVRTVSSARHRGVWDSSKYVLATNDVTSSLIINDAFVRIQGLQVESTRTTGTQQIVNVTTPDGDSYIWIDKCIVRAISPNIGGWCFRTINDNRIDITNCIGYGNVSFGIDLFASTTSRLKRAINCTTLLRSPDAIRGIIGSNPTFHFASNCYSGGDNTTDYQSVTVTSSASSDSTGSAGLKNIEPTNNSGAYFSNVTAGSEDFHISSLSPLAGAGTPYLYPVIDDIDNNIRYELWDIGAYQITQSPVPGTFLERTISQTPRKQALIDREDYWAPPQLYLEQEEPFFPARTTLYTTTARFTDLWDDPAEIIFAYFYLNPDEPFFPAVTNIPPARWFTTLPDPNERIDPPPDFWLIDDDAYIAQSVTYTTYKRFTPGLPDEPFRFILIESQDDYRPRATSFPTYTYLRQGAGWSEDETNFYVHLIDYDQPFSLQKGQVTTRFDVYARFQLSNEPEQLDFIYWDRDDAAPIAATRFTTYRFIPPIDDEVRDFSTLINDEDHQHPLAHAVTSFPRNTPSPFFHQDVFQFIYIGQIDNDPFVARATAIPQPRIPLPIDDENLQRAPLEEFFVYTAATLVAPTYARYILPDVESPILSLEENELLTLSRPFPYTPSVVLRFHDSDQPGLLWLYEEDSAWARPSPFSFQRITTARLATFQYETEVHGLGFIYPGYDEITGRARLVPLLTGHTQLTLLLTGSLRLLPTITGRLTMIEDTLPLGCDVDIEWHDAEFSSDDEPLTNAMSVTATAYITNTSDALVAGSTVTPAYDPVVGCWRATFPGTINLTEGEWYYCVMQLVVTAPASRVARGKRSLRRQALRLG